LKIREQQTISQTSEVEELLKIIQQKDKEIKSKNKEIKRKDKELKEKDKELKDVLKTPKTNITVNNNNKYNLRTFKESPDEIDLIIDTKFTEEDFLKGQKGVAIFTYDNIIKDEEGIPSHYCTDTARGKFVFKNKDGTIQTDLKLATLLKLIGNGIIKKSHRIYEVRIPEMTLDNYTQYVSNLADINNIIDDNTTFVTTLAGLTCNLITNDNDESTYAVIDDSIDDEYDEESEELMRRFYEEREQIRLSRSLPPQST